MAEIVASTYEIKKRIGSGGGGTVYLARHIRLDKEVVLKADRRKLTTKQELLRREVDALKNLNHPHIPQVYDYFVENGIVYTVIDFIQGESLDRPLKRGEIFSQAQVIDWARQLLDALSYLHSPTHGDPPRGYVHSDIKPANLMRRPDGSICLIDFNIALALGEESVVGLSEGYASPEHYGIDYSTSGGAVTHVDVEDRPSGAGGKASVGKGETQREEPRHGLSLTGRGPEERDTAVAAPEGTSDLTVAEGSGDPTALEETGDLTVAEGSGDPTTLEGSGDLTVAGGSGDPTALEGASDFTIAEGSGDLTAPEGARDLTMAEEASGHTAAEMHGSMPTVSERPEPVGSARQRQNSGASVSGGKRRIMPDVRSDIYSVGATLYHLMSGVRPAKDARDVVPLSPAQYSPLVVEIITKAMNPNPDLRYQTAAEMLAAFNSLRVRDPRVRRLKRQSIVACILLTALFAAGVCTSFVGLKRIQTNIY